MPSRRSRARGASQRTAPKPVGKGGKGNAEAASKPRRRKGPKARKWQNKKRRSDPRFQNKIPPHWNHDWEGLFDGNKVSKALVLGPLLDDFDCPLRPARSNSEIQKAKDRSIDRTTDADSQPTVQSGTVPQTVDQPVNPEPLHSETIDDFSTSQVSGADSTLVLEQSQNEAVLPQVVLTEEQLAHPVRGYEQGSDVPLDTIDTTTPQSHYMEGTTYQVNGALGEFEVARESHFTRWCRETATKLTPAPRDPTKRKTLTSIVDRAIRRRVAWALMPTSDPVSVGVLEAIADGRIQPTHVPTPDARGVETLQALGPDPNLQHLPNRTTSQPEVALQTRRRKASRRRSVRLPVLAGELTAILRGIHGPIADDDKGRSLIRNDASRKARALKDNGDVRFKDLRAHDLHRVIVWASAMFWMKSDVDEDCDELFSSSSARNSVKTRNRIASRMRAGTQE